MKKTFLLIAMIVGVANTSCESDEQISNNDRQQNDQTKLADINSYENWDAFDKAYSEYAKMDTEDLEAVSFYSIEEDDMSYSPAIQAIINNDNQFKLNNEIIELVDGDFIKRNYSKNGQSTPEKVGSVTYKPVPNDTEFSKNNGGIEINHNNKAYWELKEFRQQQYINCKNGVNHGGPSARNFRFLHQVYGEYIIRGFAQHSYTLWLRLYLEYNHRGGSWRLSGENREISVNVTDRSYLTQIAAPRNGIGYPDFSGNPSNYSIRWSSSCHSHKTFPLRETRDVGAIGGTPVWVVNLSGTITEKMSGDAVSNKWVHNINW